MTSPETDQATITQLRAEAAFVCAQIAVSAESKGEGDAYKARRSNALKIDGRVYYEVIVLDEPLETEKVSFSGREVEALWLGDMRPEDQKDKAVHPRYDFFKILDTPSWVAVRKFQPGTDKIAGVESWLSSTEADQLAQRLAAAKSKTEIELATRSRQEIARAQALANRRRRPEVERLNARRQRRRHRK